MRFAGKMQWALHCKISWSLLFISCLYSAARIWDWNL